MSETDYILMASILTQFAVVILALRLVTITQNRLAWLLIAFAIFLMGIRRMMTFLKVNGESIYFSAFQTELVALLISVLMLIGVALIVPLFRSIQNSELELQRFKTALDQTLDCIFMFDPESLKFLYVNQGAVNQLGYTKEELIGLTPMDMEPSYNSKSFRRMISPLLEGKKSSITFETMHKHKSGHLVPVEIFLQYVTFPGDGGRFVAIVKDMTEQKRNEEELRKYREHLEELVGKRTIELKEINHSLEAEIKRREKTECQLRLSAEIVENSREGIMVTDAEGVIMSVNPAFTEITQFSEEEVVGQNPRILKSNKHTKAFYTEMWKSLKEKGHWHGEIWNQRKNGEVYPQFTSITAIVGTDGEIKQYAGLFQDITEAKRHEAEINKKAYHDQLTGLPNRFMLQDRLAHAIALKKRDGKKLALFFIDLDGFKEVNDDYGHDAGDALLQDVAAKLLDVMRTEDTVSRLGGDEFIILVEDVSDLQNLKIVAQKLISSIKEPFVFRDIEIVIGASMGISIFPSDGTDIESLIKKADLAMYDAKKNGKNNFRFYVENPEDDLVKV